MGFWWKRKVAVSFLLREVIPALFLNLQATKLPTVCQSFYLMSNFLLTGLSDLSYNLKHFPDPPYLKRCSLCLALKKIQIKDAHTLSFHILSRSSCWKCPVLYSWQHLAPRWMVLSDRIWVWPSLIISAGNWTYCEPYFSTSKTNFMFPMTLTGRNTRPIENNDCWPNFVQILMCCNTRLESKKTLRIGGQEPVTCGIARVDPCNDVSL